MDESYKLSDSLTDIKQIVCMVIFHHYENSSACRQMHVGRLYTITFRYFHGQ